MDTTDTLSCALDDAILSKAKRHSHGYELCFSDLYPSMKDEILARYLQSSGEDIAEYLINSETGYTYEDVTFYTLRVIENPYKYSDKLGLVIKSHLMKAQSESIQILINARCEYLFEQHMDDAGLKISMDQSTGEREWRKTA